MNTTAPEMDSTDAPGPLLSAADHAFWREHGYLVVPNVVPEALCAAARADIADYLGVDLDAPLEAAYAQVLPQDRGGFVNLTQSQALWDTRQSPRLHQAFSEIYGTPKLWVSLDQAHMKLPYRQVAGADGIVQTWGNGGAYFGPDDPRNDGGGLHWDVHGGGLQNAETAARKKRGEPTGGLWAGPGLPDMLTYGDGYPCGPQGVLYLNDRDEDGGGFRCVPGFHRRFHQWLASLPQDRSLEQEDGGHWLANHPDLEDLFAEARNIPAKAGSLVIWHRLLPHTNGRNLSETPRFAQYITMGSVPDDPAERAQQAAQNVERWQKRGPAWSGPLADDERVARQQRREREAPPAALTELGQRLVGAMPWE
ncbi:MAG: hypothetical protein GKR89_34120 [Candidatus Latescibacteria bacterium]|nr:hypothetical protein [Candidatus Latescibacterota bacterium]